MRRGSLDAYGSPPFSGYFPHDLDDIYEYKTDHQYFTHTGNSSGDATCTPYLHSKSVDHKPPIHNDQQRNHFFHRTPAAASLDECTPSNHSVLCPTDERPDRVRAKFDNSSFARSLNDSSDASIGQSPREKSSKTSIHGMIKTLSKKAHIWPRRRHESTSSMGADGHAIGNGATNDAPETFRSRSKSLDVNYTNNILNDCDATYKIYDKIVREGNYIIYGLDGRMKDYYYLR